MRIEPVTSLTIAEVLRLVGDYQRFYCTEPDGERNRAHFSRLLEDPALGVQFLALGDGDAALGFATLYFPLSSVSARAQCLMNDLYVVPEARGQGVGRALIERCRQYARALGYAELYWQTEQSNVAAQRLYESMGALRSEWYTYTLPVID